MSGAITEHIVSPQRVRSLGTADGASFDVAVIGGGIHGACLARQLAINDFRVLLLEREDFAYGTSSRSSKLLHGGVRYLQHGDIALVRRALQERALVTASAPHLSRPQRFLFPVVSGLTPAAWQLRLGLTAYDLLAQSTRNEAAAMFPPHRRLPRDGVDADRLRRVGLRFGELFEYYDAQMDDARLVVENVVAAEMLGAVPLNYVNIDAIRQDGAEDGYRWHIDWQCRLSQRSGHSQARFVANVAGPWVREAHRLIGEWPSDWPQMLFSRGTHLLFDVNLGLPALILPTGTPGRFYFVLPYFSAAGQQTLVGTTDKEIPRNEDDPQPSAAEISELLEFVARDLPQANLNTSSLYQTFAGVRLLVAPRVKKHRISAVSRGEEIVEADSYVALLGGKYTTARHTAENLAKTIKHALRPESILKSTAGIPLPGGIGWDAGSLSALRRELGHTMNDCVTDDALDAVIARFGTRARHLLAEGTAPPDQLYSSHPPYAADALLRLQTRYVVQHEHACCLADIMRRRLGLALLPGADNAADVVSSELLAMGARALGKARLDE